MKRFILERTLPADYKTWKRKNVTIRGMQETGQENGGGAMLGNGLYTAFLSNTELSKQYGEISYVLNALPKKPKVFNTLNDWEIWCQQNLYPSPDGYPSLRDFTKQGKTIEGEMQKLGYDGIIIKGREIVNYTPPENIMYFQNDNQLMEYYYRIIKQED